VAAACRLVPEGLRSGRMPDLLGTALVASGVGATVLGMSRGQEWGWTDVKTLTCLAGGPLLVVLALTDMIAGHIPTTFVPILEAYAQKSNPNVRILAVSGPNRAKSMPDVPTIAETYPGFSAISWTGMLAPKGTPRPIIDKLSSEMIRATKDPKFLAVLTEAGIDPIAEGPEKFAAMIAAELPVWKKAVEIAGVKIQQ